MGRRAMPAELPERKFGGTVRVGADIIRPVVSPNGETTSAQRADNAISNILQMKFGGIMSKHGAFGNVVTFPGQYGSAQKFATLAGGYYPPLRRRTASNTVRILRIAHDDCVRRGGASK